MQSKNIEYTSGKTQLRGYVVYDDTIKSPQKRPAVIIAHAWKGLDKFAKEKAKMLAELGYVAFAADLYGDGKEVTENDEAFELMAPLFVNRKVLRERIVAAYQTVSQLDNVDPKRIGAIGFCFGGLTVIELLRSGVDLSGVVSFHGLLGGKLGPLTAKLAPKAPKIKGSLLILHGYKDPMVSQLDIVEMEQELAAAGIDWQFHIFGSATHAFTNPEANSPESGLQYHEQTEKRALGAMKLFFKEVFGS